MIRCSRASTGEPLAGSAPVAETWVVVEHPEGWADAPLTRSGHGVRVLMARGPRTDRPSEGRVWVAHTGSEPVLRVGTLPSPEEVAGWALDQVAAGALRAWGDPVAEPLLVVCANGRRDRCCGHEGGRLAHALWQGGHAGQVLTGSHLGGHRFAPTALVLPHGAVYGRLDATACAEILVGASGAGAPDGVGGADGERVTGGSATGHGRHPSRSRLPANGLRGFSALPEAAQVADVLVRTRLGLDWPCALAVELAPTAGGERALARVRLPDARIVEVALERRTLEVLASCGREAQPTVRWVAADDQPGLPPQAAGL